MSEPTVKLEQSSLTCAKCGEPVMWRQVPEYGPDAWLLELDGAACIWCGSHLFNVTIKNPLSHCRFYGIDTSNA